MNEKLNPLTLFFFLLAFLILVFKTQSWTQFIALVGLLLAVILMARLSVTSIVSRMRPIIIFLPVMFIFYFLVTIILTETSVNDIGRSLALSSSRILLMILSTTVFLQITSTSSSLSAVRTIWLKLGLKWRVVEDGFQLLYLTFRFFPMLKDEAKGAIYLENFLAISPVKSRLERIKRTALYLPSLIANCLHRAENLGVAMETRRYGRVLPRGVARPVGFGMVDVISILLFLFFVRGYLALA